MLKILIVLFPMLSFAYIAPVLPDAQAFRGWQPVEGYVTSNLNLQTVPKVPLNCAADPSGLYPTHPQQSTKLYHRFDQGSYDHFKLTRDSEACALGSNYKNARGEYACVRPDMAYFVVMSDIYQDKCGNLYRAYWDMIYLKKWESMGTLFSKGRTMYPDPKSEFKDDYILGETYRVPLADIKFLSPVLAGDRDNVNVARERAQSTHRFNVQTSLYKTK